MKDVNIDDEKLKPPSKNRLNDVSEENNKKLIQNLNTYRYTSLREEFNIIYARCCTTLWVTEEHLDAYKKYRNVLGHYFRNGANGYLRYNYSEYTTQERYKERKNYLLFLSIVSRIEKLSPEQKILFLEWLYAETDLEKPLNIIDKILSSAEGKQ